jgi:quinol monooxygenase YgiN
MVNVGLFVRLGAKPGKEKEVETFLLSGLPLVQDEPATTAWFGIRLGPTTFVIFDAFPDEAGRQAHLSGKIAAALMARAGALFHLCAAHGPSLRFRPRTYRAFPKSLLLSFVVMFLMNCAGGTVRDYTPKSPGEEIIKTSLIEFETAWNNHNENALLDLLDGDFIMWQWSEGSRRIVFDKGRFGFRLRDLFIRWRYMGLGSPDIWINDGKATAYVALSLDGRGYRSTFRLVNRDGRWLFLEWEF